MKNYITKIHYSKNLNFMQRLIKGVLALCTPFYSFGSSFKVFLYNKNVIKSRKIDAFVISIGNLTTGGTGKTPLTIAITNYLKSMLHKNTAILSRGYGGSLSVEDNNEISNGKEILYSPEQAGDEPYLIAFKTGFTPVITGKDRVKSGNYAVDKFSPEIVILDDGFQHLKLERNLNLLVIDADKRFGNALTLPAGPLRENIGEIIRTDKIILTCKKQTSNEKSEFADFLRLKYNKPVFICNFKYGKPYNIKTKEILPNNVKNVFAFAGIAHPGTFFDVLTEQGYNLMDKKEFADHYAYSVQDLEKIILQAKENNAEAIITTEKDYVKLIESSKNLNNEVAIYAFPLEVELDLENLLNEVK